MKIAIIGSRGIPAQYGGFETLAERLAQLLAGNGHAVTVIGEQPAGSIGPVRIIKTIFSKRKFPVLFYLESVLRARKHYDAVLLLGVGAGPFVSLLDRKGSRLITNVDGLEHLRW